MNTEVKSISCPQQFLKDSLKDSVKDSPKDFQKNSLLRIACLSDANVLLNGPTGCGKTRLAQLIHERSARKAKPFVAVNLASLHEGTLESELFGHERGAFTGAECKRVGKLELANGGTIFLDEIGDLTPRLQARLLEFLQSKTISPVGGNRVAKLDVRIIAATHRNLQECVKTGDFREDLFHRLRVVCIRMQSLRDRSDDFDSIVHALLEELCSSLGKKVLRLSERVAQLLERYDWPGNIRELRNVLEYCAYSCDGVEIRESDLPNWFLEIQHEPPQPFGIPVLGSGEFKLSLDYHECIAKFEKEYLKRALSRYKGKVGRTAKAIGLSKTTLIRRVKAHGLVVGWHPSMLA